MSYVRVNIADANHTISGDLHGSMTDPLVAALTAEPETIEEFQTALERFIKTESDWTPLRGFVAHENTEPYDAGIVYIDLAARVIGVESTYSSPSKDGMVRVPNEFADDDDDIHVPYRLPDDWIIEYSIPSYEGVSHRRRTERALARPFDARPMLYGRPLIKFIVDEIFQAEDLNAEDLFTHIHAKWLMTPREYLRGRTPREILLEKQDFISFDLHSRSAQWSFTKKSPAPLSSDSFAYVNAAFGIHEAVVYYYLIRFLLGECATRLEQEGEFSIDNEIERLSKLRDAWLRESSEFGERAPVQILDFERRRINMTVSAQESLIDEDCPCCVAMSEDFDTPMFWFLDGCNMDYQFEFSFYKTREEWEAEQRRYEEFNREFAEGKWQENSDADSFEFDEEPF